MRWLARLRFILTDPIGAFQHWRRPVLSVQRLESGLHRHAYPSYDAYLQIQAEKLSRHTPAWLEDYEQRYAIALQEHLRRSGLVRPGLPVLCLAARLGAEVRAFRALGAFAVGIDLNPGPDNPYVLRGDFHALTFAAQSVGLVFTNSLDHAYDLPKVLGEVRRVLQPGGIFLTEIVHGRPDGQPHGYYDVLGWVTVDEVVTAITAQGFSLVTREPSAFAKDWCVFTPA